MKDHYVEMMKQDITRLGSEITILKEIIFGKHTKKLYSIWKVAATINTNDKKAINDLAQKEASIQAKIKRQNDPKEMDRLMALESAQTKFRQQLAEYLLHEGGIGTC